jgi:hypothetical protein
MASRGDSYVRKTGSGRRTRAKRVKKSAPPVAAKKKYSSEEFTPEQWERIREHIRARGMTFGVFLPEPLADWLREKLDAGAFEDPGEAAFVAFQDLRELDRHPAVRKALLKAMIKSSAEHPRRGISFEEWRKEHQAQLRRYAESEPPSK